MKWRSDNLLSIEWWFRITMLPAAVGITVGLLGVVSTTRLLVSIGFALCIPLLLVTGLVWLIAVPIIIIINWWHRHDDASDATRSGQ